MYIAILTALAGEFKVVPFSGEAFRFGLGSTVFFLLNLIEQPKSYLRTGILTGLTVLVFRLIKDFILEGTPSLGLSLHAHYPAFVFYILYAIGLVLIKPQKYRTEPLFLGGMISALEFVVNGVEHILRSTQFQSEEWLMLMGVAIFRSYFVVGIYSGLVLKDQSKRMEQVLKTGSGLYAETLYLKKSMENIESIMALSHDLYQKLRKSEHPKWSRQALQIAQEIHEVKKDSQRILAGLSKLYLDDNKQTMKLSELLEFVIHANEKYSERLGRQIHFTVTQQIEDFATDRYLPLLTILNNLVANAVEAIRGSGAISIEVNPFNANLQFSIRDNGPGITEEDLELIFEPGFTTKFNEEGVAATGIGLSHVEDIILTLKGTIEIKSTPEGTTCTLTIPITQVKRGEL
nr:sensor histidine kinase [Ammoniphilus resinae]